MKRKMTPKYSKQLLTKLREVGAQDAKAGKSIMAFYELPYSRHYEWMRAAYEMGWRAAKAA
jgi:hypothetical protein